ncbi:MAG: RNA-binding S4 domain-containing protein [Lentimicrobiaceae bacterium]|nr:RNA-binding S4 domain-containing protein [Lentimicrobiaceae bacterium]
MDEGLRIDKWLWAVRIYKTRTLAGEACRAGKVKMQGQAVKPSRSLKKGDIIDVSLGPLNKTIQVIELIQNRVSAKLVSQSMLDLTPPEEYERIKFMYQMKSGMRERGSGRPTKKERRDLDKLTGDD